MKKIIALVGIAVIAGCRPQYVKDGVTDAEAQRDLQECRYQAELATGNMREGFHRADRINDLVASCLKMRGYYMK